MGLKRKTREDIRMLRFEDVHDRYAAGKISCEGAAELLAINRRTFLRWRHRYEEHGGADWPDLRLGQAPANKAADREVERITKLYREKYHGFSVKHFHQYLCWEEGFARSYSWVKRALVKSGVVTVSTRGGKHRLRRPRRPQAGMMMHQDGSTHVWFGDSPCDLIITMDDATSLVTSGFFCEQEGTLSSLRGLAETIAAYGLFCSLYTDRGSHYWYTPEAGEKVDKSRLTEVGRACQQLGIRHIPAYSPQARGRSERLFGTLQQRLTAELALHGISHIEDANRYLREIYLPRHNQKFTVLAADPESAFIPYVGRPLEQILCVQEDRTVGADNTVRYQGMILQIPANKDRPHYVRCDVTICRHIDGTLSILHGHRCIGRYTSNGAPLQKKTLPCSPVVPKKIAAA
jgi:transposase